MFGTVWQTMVKAPKVTKKMENHVLHRQVFTNNKAGRQVSFKNVQHHINSQNVTFVSIRKSGSSPSLLRITEPSGSQLGRFAFTTQSLMAKIQMWKDIKSKRSWFQYTSNCDGDCLRYRDPVCLFAKCWPREKMYSTQCCSEQQGTAS